ncbi:MAG: hypothetical protein IKZ09_11865, partial [Clostridia bacterium]|nr:hypothetical protein [Clostridia bacterium]
RIAEVFKEDPLYASLGEVTTPGIQFVSSLLIVANETYCFYGNGVQISDALIEYEHLLKCHEEYRSSLSVPKLKSKEIFSFPKITSFRIPQKTNDDIDDETRN